MLLRNTVVSTLVFLIGLLLLWVLVEFGGMDEVIAAGAIAGLGLIIYLVRNNFKNTYSQTPFYEILSIVLPVILFILMSIYIWQRRSRFAIRQRGRVHDERIMNKGKFFVGREELTTKFHRALNPKIDSERVFAISGVGGIGKTAMIE